MKGRITKEGHEQVWDGLGCRLKEGDLLDAPIKNLTALARCGFVELVDAEEVEGEPLALDHDAAIAEGKRAEQMEARDRAIERRSKMSDEMRAARAELRDPSISEVEKAEINAVLSKLRKEAQTELDVAWTAEQLIATYDEQLGFEHEPIVKPIIDAMRPAEPAAPTPAESVSRETPKPAAAKKPAAKKAAAKKAGEARA